RADIYSLGVVLYEMLTGGLPLGHFTPASQKAPVDVRIDAVVQRALEKDPDRRFQHVAAVQSDIETIGASLHPAAAIHGPHPGQAPTPAQEAVQRRVGKPATALLIVGMATLVQTLVYVLEGFSWHANQAEMNVLRVSVQAVSDLFGLPVSVLIILGALEMKRL